MKTMKESSKFINKILVLALSLIMLLLSCPFVCTALAIEGKTQAEDSEVVDTKNKLQITYYNVGNGDCAFVKWNNFEMLIDTGEKAGNLDVFAGYNKIIQTIKEKCEDKCLDYIVATHGDSDHIGLMDQVLNAFDKTGDLSGYKLKNILDFDSENIAGMYKDLYNRYATARQKRVDDKTNYIPVTTCFKSKTFDSDFDEAKDSCRIPFDVGEANTPYLNILYNKYYFLTSTESVYKNSVSVCMCIEYGNTKVLMTGDLEERNSGANKNLYGETWLVENYPKLFENGVTLYKVGHHGSNSSSSKKLISTIKPKYVIISAIANSKATNDQGYWRFPRQEVLDTLLAATNNVYITGAQDASGQNANYHGDVTFTMDDNENVEVTCVRKDNSIDGKYIDKETHNACEIYDNNGELLKLYETEWFKQNRKYGLEVHVFSGFESQNNAYVGSCTLIKLGTLDILIDCGAVYDFGYSAYATSHFVEKVKSWCMDGVIEYVVVTSPTEKSLLYFADSAHGDKVVRKGIFSTFEVKNVIDCGDSYNPSQGDERSHFKAYTEARSEAVAKGANYKTALQLVQNGTNRMQVGEEFYLTILNNSHYGHNGKDRFLSFVSTMIEYKGKKLIFMPPGTTEELENEIVDKNKNNIAGAVFLLASDFGLSANSENLFNAIGKQQLTTVFTGIPGATISGITCLNDSMRSKFVNGSGKTYFGVELTNGGKYNEVCGDLFFRVYIGANNVVNTEMNASKECIDLSQWYDGNK